MLFRSAPTATLDDVVTHVEHVREVAGVDHVGLGGDYDGVEVLPTGLEDVSTVGNEFTKFLDYDTSKNKRLKDLGLNRMLHWREALAAYLNDVGGPSGPGV